MPPAHQVRRLQALIRRITPEVLLLSINEAAQARMRSERADEAAEPGGEPAGGDSRDVHEPI